MAKEYIDREVVKNAITADGYEHFSGCLSSSEIRLLELMLDSVSEIPAADVALVRHERWDENGRCTGCGGHAPFWCMASTYYESPYCSECGARMDGDKQ